MICIIEGEGLKYIHGFKALGYYSSHITSVPKTLYSIIDISFLQTDIIPIFSNSIITHFKLGNGISYIPPEISNKQFCFNF